MKRTKWMLISLGILIAMGLIMTVVKLERSSQAYMPKPKAVEFNGEYSLDGGPWKSLTPGSRIPADAGDLLLRGNFDLEYDWDGCFYFYIDHMDMTVKINGEEVIDTFKPTKNIAEDFCGRYWYVTHLQGITKDDRVEILLHQSHNFGYQNAYRDFLNKIYYAPEAFLNEYLLGEGQNSRIVSLVAIVLSLIILGFALAFSLIGVQMGGRMALFGVSSLLMSIYIGLDTQDVYLWSERILFNTSITQISMMFAALGFCYFATEGIKERFKLPAHISLVLLTIFDAVLILLSTVRAVRICSTLIPWVFMQGAACIVLLICQVGSLCEKEGIKPNLLLITCTAMTALILIDLVGSALGWRLAGICSKSGFVIMLTFFLIWTMRAAPKHYRQALRTEQLEGELEESRIAVMVSQIHPHFLFNALSTIRHLCRTDSNQAWAALGDFSAYLRANTDALTSTKLIPFSQELRHIQSYLKLEKLRFGDRLNIVYDLEEENFLIPPLTVQPLVENAVKHGIFYAKDGGTICVATRKRGNGIDIVISDDGVGFDMNGEVEENDRVHVGLHNVKIRLGKLLHAQMIVESEKNKGTTVTIHIG